jgi:hypothetical protein
LFLPRRVDVFKERFAESEIDLDHLGPVIATCRTRVGHIQVLCKRIYKILSPLLRKPAQSNVQGAR